MRSGRDESRYLQIRGHGCLPENSRPLPPGRGGERLMVFLVNEGKSEHESERRICAAPVPTLTCGHKLWVVNVSSWKFPPQVDLV